MASNPAAFATCNREPESQFLVRLSRREARHHCVEIHRPRNASLERIAFLKRISTEFESDRIAVMKRVWLRQYVPYHSHGTAVVHNTRHKEQTTRLCKYLQPRMMSIEWRVMSMDGPACADSISATLRGSLSLPLFSILTGKISFWLGHL